jgi:type IV pilus assembly protein PilC
MPLFRCKIGSADSKIIEKEFEAASADIQAESFFAGLARFQHIQKLLQFLWNLGASCRKIDTKALLSIRSFGSDKGRPSNYPGWTRSWKELKRPC